MKREYPSAPVVAVGAVVCHQGKVLLVRRGHEPAMGRWVIPGGGVELGETVRDAVRREIREECGIEISVANEPAAVVDRIDRDTAGRVRYHYVIIDYLADYQSGMLTPGSDVTAAQWVDPADLPTYDLTPISIDLVRMALERCRKRQYNQ